MKIEIGKAYINRYGEIVDIIEKDGTEYCPMVGKNRSTGTIHFFQVDGVWSYMGSMEDLIKEHIENERTT